MAVRQVIGRDAGALAEFLKHCAAMRGTLAPLIQSTWPEGAK